MEIKQIKVIWEAEGSYSQKGGVGWLDSTGQEALRNPGTKADLIKKLDEAMESLKDINAERNERNIYNDLRSLEIKSHPWTVDNKLEILRLKHKNMELIVDTLVADPNEHVNQKHKSKQARGK